MKFGADRAEPTTAEIAAVTQAVHDGGKLAAGRWVTRLKVMNRLPRDWQLDRFRLTLDFLTRAGVTEWRNQGPDAEVRLRIEPDPSLFIGTR